jgi:membrane associated rhomboid family serine protease
MAFPSRNSGSFSFSSAMTPGVKWLLIANVGLFLINFLAARFMSLDIFSLLGLVPRQVVGSFTVWQLGTYMFLHSVFSLGHILFNMLALWMFGTSIEQVWGTRRFLKYYMICGIGAGVCVVILNYLFGSPNTRTIGSSGAVYGLMLAFGMLFPEATIYFSFLFPIKAKYYVMLMAAIVFLSSLGDTGGTVSHFAHLGGMAVGYAYLKSGLDSSRRRAASRGPGPVERLRHAYKEWKFQRAKRKFEVYLRKQGPGGDGTIH